MTEGSWARSFAEEMAALRLEYLEALPARLDELSEAVARARKTPLVPARVREVKALAHSLCGTAGTFGLHAIGEAAGRIEDAARRHLERLPEGTGAFDEIDAALRAARRSLEAEG